jgi:ABC-type transporter MlaC component
MVCFHALSASRERARRRRQLTGVLGLGLLPLALSAGAAEPPLEVIRATVTQVLAALHDPAAQGEEQRARRRAAVRAIALPRFDAAGMAARALGPPGASAVRPSSRSSPACLPT